ncbi:Helicase HerA, central domain [anaerobic digester metagenome]
MRLFPKDKVVGIFRGFRQGGLEFHAELVLPYQNSFQSAPMHGQFLLIQLETEDEGVLGRITSISSEGRLASSSGEDYGIRAIADDRQIPEDLREQYLKYRVDIRVLGVIRVIDGKVVFAASHRRLPHVGSKVAFLSDELLKEVAGHNIEGADLGFFSLGEFVYCADDSRFKPEPWIRVKSPAIVPRFPIQNLVSRRSFVFARAGFGKSNLNKLLFSSLYKETPTVEKRGGRRVPVGTLIFDPDGEYYWPDDKNRPGLCDVPELEDKLVVFTKKKGPSPFYQSFVAGDIKLDIRRLKPSDVISIALAPEKQEQQNVRKLKGLNDQNWKRLVDEIYENENLADPDLLKELLHLTEQQEAEMVAARANMTSIVRMLHDPGSQMLDMLLNSLREGKLCIIDISQLRGEPALILSGIILQKIFEYNQEQFTVAQPQTIPTIAVVEEAQSVLGGSKSSPPYVSWVKEGRKYDLGAMLITQQPGSIASEILSQGDNWFVFHLLSAVDLQALKKANAHFSDDLLSALLNEPLVGNGIFWSSAEGKSYPIPVRVLLFEELYDVRDPNYELPAANTFAQELKTRFKSAVTAVAHGTASVKEDSTSSDSAEVASEERGEEPMDVYESYISSAIQSVKNNFMLVEEIRRNGKPWYGIIVALMDALPAVIDENERKQIAHNNVPRTMDEIFGPNQWTKEKRPKKSGPGLTVWIVLKKEN